MAERICGMCGTRNAADAQFCKNCDNYLGWDVGASTLAGEALTGTIPTVVGAVPAEPAPAPAAGDAGDAAAAGEAVHAGASSGAHGAPAVTVATPEVVVTADAPADVGFTIENRLSIVDGYVLEAVDPPAWLVLAHPDVHLMPGEERRIALSLALRDDTMVIAQRVPLTVVVRSVEDDDRRATAELVVTIPPYGPPPTMNARPTLIRLEDTDAGRFAVVLDNRAANHPQTFEMSGSDSEGVIAFEFTPSVVEVPAGAMVEVAGLFRAPPPAPGAQLNRQLTVAATNDAGTISAVVTLVQSAAAAPVDAPIGVRVQPSSIRLLDSAVADFEVHVDNRGGHSGVTVALSGSDPERRMSFAFVPARFVAVAGQVTRANGRLRAPLPPRGTSATLPFTVVASDGSTDAEASASVEITASPGAMTTAELRVHPENLDIGTRGEGAFSVEVDNRTGAEPLTVVLSGHSADGLARVRFTPPRVVVAPGAVGHARMSVSSPHPPARQLGTRRLEIAASDGAQSITARAELTQTGADRRRPAGRWLVIVGAGLVLLGALALPWFTSSSFGIDLTQLNGETLKGGVDDVLADGRLSASGVGASEVVPRILLAVLAVMMLFGLTGKGGMTRKSAILGALVVVAYLVALGATSTLPSLLFGIPVILGGLVLAYIGGVLVRPAD